MAQAVQHFCKECANTGWQFVRSLDGSDWDYDFCECGREPEATH